MAVLDGHLAELREALDDLQALAEPLAVAAQAIAASLTGGGKLLAAGNGGSAAQAQHLTGELLGRLRPDRERGPLAAIALHADSSTMTAVANDYGYEQVFARQVRALARPGDSLAVLSTSGTSANLVAAVAAASERGVTTVALTGADPRALGERCEHVLAVPSAAVGAIQECHLVLLHVLVELIEDHLT